MRFYSLSAVLVAATALVSGVAAEEPTVATTTLTRTLQRVGPTVTQTRATAGLVTGSTTPSGVVIATGAYSTPSISATGAPAAATGAAMSLQFNAAGLVAVAGAVGYLAL